MDRLSPQMRQQLAQFQQTQQKAQALSSQKMQLEVAFRETERALEELEKIDEDTPLYKSVGGILVKTGLSDAREGLEDRKETLELRIKTIERQEERVNKRVEKMRAKIEEGLKGQGSVGTAG